MSVYRASGSRFYVYDFRRGGRRFLGPTGAASEREARRVEARAIEQAEREVAAARLLDAEFKGALPLTLDAAAGRWWSEVGQHRADGADLFEAVGGLIEHLGRDRRLDAITDADVAQLVASVRGRHVRGDPDAPLLSPARVNDLTVDLLRTIYGRARRAWKIAIATEPNWREHRLAEPEEITRELAADEEAILLAVTSADYARLYRFAWLSGLRQRACLIRKPDVKWSEGRIEVRSKGGRLNRVPLSAALREIIAACWDDHPEFVFTFEARGRHRGRIKRQRYPITPAALKSQWRRDRASAAKIVPSIATLRFHDLRHTAATRILRATGNLKIAQQLLNHARISTTAKYAHVLESELLAAMDAVAAPPAHDITSRDGSRGKRRGAA